MSVTAEELEEELKTLKLTKAQLAEVQAFGQQVVHLGCALLPVLPEEDVKAEIFASAREVWIKVCRGDVELEQAYPKVVMFTEELLEPLFAASRAVGRVIR